jgi:hypothetical protein
MARNNINNLQAPTIVDSNQWIGLVLVQKALLSKSSAFCVSLAPLFLTQSDYIVPWKYP